MFLVGGAFRLAFRLRVHGLGRIPARGGVLLVINHVSILDAIGVGLATTRRGRPARFVTASEVFDLKVVGWGVRKIHQIPIRRGMADRAALREAAAVIRDGALAGIFPEGRVSEDASLARLQKGAARLALTAAVPLVPMGIWGTNLRWPRGGLRLGLPLRPRVAIVVGEPIAVAGDPRSAADVRALTVQIAERLGELAAVARRAAR